MRASDAPCGSNSCAYNRVSFVECGMLSRQNVATGGFPPGGGAPFPTVCVVTLDEEFMEVLKEELLPWFRVVARDTYDDLARRTREQRVSAVVLDIDTQGEDPYGGLPVLNELRKLNGDFTLI